MLSAKPLLLIVIAILSLVDLVAACCANGCSGHGICTAGTCTCSCDAQFTGGDCSLRVCPSSYAWVGDAAGTDDIHDHLAECSNAGLCDRSSGLCKCNNGFEGMACERLSCPNDCGTNGVCVSLAEAAILRDDRNFFRNVVYTEWDANKIYGCKCSIGWTGHDCSIRECIYGNDPEVAGVDEVQVIECTCPTTCSGSFYLQFRGETTDAIPHDADATVVEAKLEALLTITDVTISFGATGSTVCDNDGVSTTVTFIREGGDVPSLIPFTGTLASSGGTATLGIYTDDTTANAQSVSAVTGTKSWRECNGRGTCVRSTGLCTCGTGYASSDGAGSAGTLGDCGYASASQCPGTTACSGHGTCSSNVCTCYTGWKSHDCSLRTCPTGEAWFAEPGYTLPGLFDVANAATTVTSTDDCRGLIDRGDTLYINGQSLTVDLTGTFDATTITVSSAYTGTTVTNVQAYRNPQDAHYHVECSGRGTCDEATGACTCDSGFEGAACQLLSCPTSLSTECSGHGRCMTLAKLAEETEVNGDSTSYTYGDTPGKIATWDAKRIRGCKCDKSLYKHGQYDFGGADCSLLYCRKGDDPSTAGVAEVQTINCIATAGTFTLTFRQETTAALAFGATEAEVEAALEALDTIDDVGITFTPAGAACDGTGVDIAVTFNNDNGNVPAISMDTSSLTGPTVTYTETTPGTTENVECSNHGNCDRTLGVCNCFSGYVSSDGTGSQGTRGDCGFRDALFVAGA